MILAVEGNIGAGKTTFIELATLHLRSMNYKVKNFNEGVDDTPLKYIFQKFIEEPDKYTFGLQLSFFSFIYQQTLTAKMFADMGYICFLDRSLFGNEVFTLLNYGMDRLNNSEYSILSNMFRAINNHEMLDHIIYVQTDVEKCIDRCEKRGREGENSYDIKYFKSLESVYQRRLATHQGSVKYVDWNLNILEAWDNTKSMIENILEETKIF